MEMTDEERERRIVEFMDSRIRDAWAQQMAKWIVRTEHEVGAMSEPQRIAYMKANGMYPGPDYDPTYYEDPAAWWARYEAANPA